MIYSDQHHHLEAKADDLSEDIVKKFSQYRVNITIKNWIVKPDRIIYQLKLKGDTRESHVLARAPDVQLRLKLPLFQVFKHQYTIFISASDREIQYARLPQILSSRAYAEASKKMKLPYVVGHNPMGELVIVDLAIDKHMLLGGSTGSGKSVGLQCLTLSMITGKSPAKVNLIIIDVGANSLMPFDGIPHLSYPVIRDRETALKVLMLLKAEMERRIELEVANPSEFKLLPRIVCEIDESPALLTGLGDKELSKLLVEVISCLLQRGRHAKIHLVLAAQNPTFQNMKVDLGNITARAAFRCAKRNFSETILGEGGAEDLTGQGDMYFKTPQHDELQRIQGAYITSQELKQVLHIIKTRQYPGSMNDRKFIISETDLLEQGEDIVHGQTSRPSSAKRDADDKLFARILMWALERKSISCNILCDTFNIGWKRASGFLDKLAELGIAGDMYAKLPRAVLPRNMEDIPTETIEFLSKHGVSEDDIVFALDEKSTT